MIPRKIIIPCSARCSSFLFSAIADTGGTTPPTLPRPRIEPAGFEDRSAQSAPWADPETKGIRNPLLRHAQDQGEDEGSGPGCHNPGGVRQAEGKNH